MWAFLNDCAQRVITWNKLEQKVNLSRWLKNSQLKPGQAKILDFGCGTGLFARTFRKEGFAFYGYDVDVRLTNYASRLYPDCQFMASKTMLEQEAPFDMILANCCFHHIDDSQLSIELELIKRLLSNDGIFLMKDILKVESDRSFLFRSYMKMERGQYLRTKFGYRKLIEEHFVIKGEAIESSHFLSFKNKYNPVYNDLVVFECEKA